MSATDVKDDDKETESTIGDAVSAQADEATRDGISASYDDEDDEEEAVKPKEATSDTIEPNTYNIKPPLQDKFKALLVRNAMQEVLVEELGGKVYSAANAKQWTTNIANIINRKVKDMKWKRYKHIVQVIIGEQRGAGLKSGVKCVWDSETDNYASEIFTNDSIFCIAVVFAIYFY